MEQRQTKNVGLAVLATGIMAFSGVLIETAMNVTFPSLMAEFGIATQAVQWVTTIYLLMIAITVPISGYLLKNVPAKVLFLVANFSFLAGVTMNFLATNFYWLLGGRLLQGIATGIALPLMFQIILMEAPLKQRGMMMGLGTFATSIAPAIGPSYGGYLTNHLTWHYIYFFLIPLILLSLVIGLPTFIYRKAPGGGVLKVGNTFWLALFFTTFLCGLSFLSSYWGLLLLAASALSFYLFQRGNRRNPHPLLAFALLKNKIFAHLLATFLIYQFIFLGISFIIPNLLQIVGGLNAASSGLAMLPGALIGAVLQPIAGKVLDQIGPKKPLLFGGIVAFCGCVSLTITLYLGAGVQWFIFSHVLFQIGAGFSYSNAITTGMNALAKESTGAGNSLFNTLQQFTGAVATAVVAAVINAGQASSSSFEKGTQLGGFFSGLLLVGLMLFSIWSIWNVRKKLPAA